MLNEVDQKGANPGLSGKITDLLHYWRGGWRRKNKREWAYTIKGGCTTVASFKSPIRQPRLAEVRK